jgi:hypothetical protein
VLTSSSLGFDGLSLRSGLIKFCGISPYEVEEILSLSRCDSTRGFRESKFPGRTSVGVSDRFCCVRFLNADGGTDFGLTLAEQHLVDWDELLKIKQ